MIERQTIDGRPATVAYLDGDMNPVASRDAAELVRVVFDDGQSLWLVPAPDAAPPAP